MTDTGPSEEMIVYVFCRFGRTSTSAEYQRLRSLWDSCVLHLGLSSEIHGLDAEYQLPIDPAAVTSHEVIAAAESIGSGEQAIVQRINGFLCLSVLLSFAETDEPGRRWLSWTQQDHGRSRWGRLTQRWEGVIQGHTPFYGEVRLYLTQVAPADDPRPSGPGTGSQAGMWAALRDMPRADLNPDHVLRSGARLPGGLRLWRVDRGSVRVRQIVLADEGRDPEALSRWAWLPGGEGLPPFARYLLRAIQIDTETFALAQRQQGNGSTGMSSSRSRQLAERARNDLRSVVADAGIVPTTGSMIFEDIAAADRLVTELEDESYDWEVTQSQARNVFVVHGRDDSMRKAMYNFLRALDLRPLEWESVVAATGTTAPYLGDVVENAIRQARAVVVLLTPDDIVSLHPTLHKLNEDEFEKQLTMQPRPNVLMELGMALTAFPDRTIMVEVGAHRPIADIAGRNVIKFDGQPRSVGKLVERLKVAGCAVDDQGSDWRDMTLFADLTAYIRKPTP